MKSKMDFKYPGPCDYCGKQIENLGDCIFWDCSLDGMGYSLQLHRECNKKSDKEDFFRKKMKEYREDIKYLRKNLFKAIKMPEEFLEEEE